MSNDILTQINLIEQTFGIKVVYHDVQSGTTIQSQATQSHRSDVDSRTGRNGDPFIAL
jgi:hypothetical protein